MISILCLLAGLSAQGPDTTQTKIVPPVDTTFLGGPASTVAPSSVVVTQPKIDSSKPGPSTDTAKPLAPASVAPPPTAATPVSPAMAGPILSAGPEVDAGPVGPSGPVAPTAAKPSPKSGPDAGPMVVPAATFGPSGEIAQPTDSTLLRRSTASAMGLSLLLPGMGHRWIGRSSRAPVFHALDLLGFTALVVSWQMGNRSLESATEIANRHAGSSLGEDPDKDLLSAMRNYRSRRPQAGRHDSYDEAMLLSGKSTTWQFPDDASHDWDWGSRENPDNDVNLRSFESQLRTWRASQVALYSAAGTLVVLRLAAALDVLRLNRSSAARAGIAFETSPIPGGMESKMAVNF